MHAGAVAAGQALVARLAGWRVAVVGDVILDEYLIGTAERLSREAPIPVLEFVRREVIVGGAANPAMNIAALGSRAEQIGAIGADEGGATLRALLEARGIGAAGLIVDPTRQTTIKTRLMAQIGLRFPQQVARLDRVDRAPIDSQIAARIGERLSAPFDAILCSDYLNGLLTPEVVAHVRARESLRVADAQGELDKYSGFDVVKCNADEAARHLRRDLRSEADFAAAAGKAGGTVSERGSVTAGDGKLGEELNAAVFEARSLRDAGEGSLTDPVKVGERYSVAFVTDLKPAATQPLSAVRDQIETQVLAQKKSEEGQKFLDAQVASLKAKNNLEAVLAAQQKRVDAQTPKTPAAEDSSGKDSAAPADGDAPAAEGETPAAPPADQ
ncbi:MAG: PfkB family carbohydrate kinase [Aggregatilineales bacterium]